MNSEYLFDKKGSDIEIERLEGLLSEFRIEPVPPSLSRAKTEQRGSIFSRYKLAFTVSFASMLILFVAVGVLISRFMSRQAPDRVELDSRITNQEPRNDSGVTDPLLPVAVSKPTRIVERAEKTRQSPRGVRRAPRPTVTERAKDGTRLTPEELYAYQKLKVALFIAGSKIKIVQDTIDRVDDEKKGKDER